MTEFEKSVLKFAKSIRQRTAKQIDQKFKRTDFYNKISTRQQDQYNKIMAEFLQEKV